jgi:hypothetical protein
MRLASFLLAGSSLALLNSCSSELKVPHGRAAHHPQILTGVTEYYYSGSKPSSSPFITPLPATSLKPRGWARFTAPAATSPPATSSGATNLRTARVRILSLIHAGSPAVNNGTSTNPPTFANPDGTTSKVVGNALIKSDGTRGDIIGNTVYHSNGTTSRIVGDMLMNADGSQSTRINDNP